MDLKRELHGILLRQYLGNLWHLVPLLENKRGTKLQPEETRKIRANKSKQKKMINKDQNRHFEIENKKVTEKIQ